VKANRPDITVYFKKEKKVHLIDIAVPNTNNLQNTIKNKIEKYAELAQELRKQGYPYHHICSWNSTKDNN